MPWYALSVLAGQEQKIAKSLERVETYFPRSLRWAKRRGHGRIKKLFPLLPGYLFVQLDDLRGWSHWIRSERHVFGFVAVKGKPLAVHERDMAWLRSQEASGQYDETKSRLQALVGRSYQLVNGLFAGHDVVVKAIKNGDLVVDIQDCLFPATISVLDFNEMRYNSR